MRRRLRPENMVSASQGYGGPQPTEVAIMIATLQTEIEADQAWLKEQRDKLKAADAALDEAFAKL